MKLDEMAGYHNASMYNGMTIYRYFNKQLCILANIYYMTDFICDIIEKYFNGTIEDLYTDYNGDDEFPEITSNRSIKLNDMMFLYVDIYHPTIEDPYAKIELIPAYYEDDNHETGDCSPNMVVIDIYGRKEIEVSDSLSTSDKFFEYITDQTLLDKLNNLGNHIRSSIKEMHAE